MSNKKYTRVCECGDVAEVSYKPKKHTKCLPCAARETAYLSIHSRWEEGRDKVRYIYFCPRCPSVRITVSRRGTLCGDCSKKNVKSEHLDRFRFDFKEMKMINVRMRHFRICPHCPEDSNTKEVPVASLSGIRPCVKHKYADNPEAFKEKEAKRLATRRVTDAARRKKNKVARPKKKDKKASPEAIKKTIEINREHREAQKKIEIIPQKLSDDEMIAKFMKTHKPSVIANNSIPMPYTF